VSRSLAGPTRRLPRACEHGSVDDGSASDREGRTGVAPDGSPVMLYLALPGSDEAAVIHAAVPPGSAVLELGCGVGRVSRHLAQLGHRVTGVDNSVEMLAHIDDADGTEPILSDIATLDLSPRRWPVVVMASRLVNDDLGPAFLAAAARHVREDGCVLVERHEPGWVGVVEPSSSERYGIKMTIRNIQRPTAGVIRATMIYEVEGHQFEQSFTAHDVDDERLAEMAGAVGLTIDAILDECGVWARLRPRERTEQAAPKPPHGRRK